MLGNKIELSLFPFYKAEREDISEMTKVMSANK